MIEGHRIELRELTVNGKSLFAKWLSKLDKTEQVQVRTRLERVRHGNLGLHRNLRYGILELKFDSGLRVYGGWDGLGGDKRGQDKDIAMAEEIWLSYTKGK